MSVTCTSMLSLSLPPDTAPLSSWSRASSRTGTDPRRTTASQRACREGRENLPHPATSPGCSSSLCGTPTLAAEGKVLGCKIIFFQFPKLCVYQWFRPPSLMRSQSLAKGNTECYLRMCCLYSHLTNVTRYATGKTKKSLKLLQILL